MHGHQGHSHQKLVFQQVQQIGPGLQGQHILFAIIVFGLGHGLVGHESEPAVHLQGRDHSPQTTLTTQWHSGTRLQMHPHGGRSAGTLAHLPMCLP